MRVPHSILDNVNHAEAKLNTSERMILFSLVLGLQPRLVLEIGTLWGGSAQIVCAAMDVTFEGGIVPVDPDPKLSEATHARTIHRTWIVIGRSPEAVPPGPFDFVFIDGDHSGPGVARDLAKIMTVVDDGAYILQQRRHTGSIAPHHHPGRSQAPVRGGTSAPSAPTARPEARPGPWREPRRALGLDCSVQARHVVLVKMGLT